MAITAHLKYGKQNATTRNDLCMLTGQSDRVNRDEISDYNRRYGSDPNMPYICSHSCYSGYWLSKDIDEINMAKRGHKSRIKAHVDIIKAIDERERKIMGGE